jgi:hypothetical protein
LTDFLSGFGVIVKASFAQSERFGRSPQPSLDRAEKTENELKN